MNSPREFRTHRPSGKPSWPLILLAGAEKVGKSWEAATFSGSDLIGRTFWIELGETTAEEYGAVPGADYEVVEHNGSYQDLAAAAEWAVRQGDANGKPNAIVIDSATILWDMLSAEQQEIALRRRKPGVNGEAKVTMDQWNAAKDRWGRFLDILRRNNGPVVLLARMDVVTLVDESGQPTKSKDWKIKAEKNLPYNVGVIVSMPARGEAWLSGLQSTRLQLQEGEKRRIDGFSLDRLMREMGLAEEGAAAPRQYTASRPDADEAMADAGPQRPAQRSRPAAPAEDEWTTPQSAPPSPLMPTANPEQIAELAKALRFVRGITEPSSMLAAVSAMIHRELTDARQLTKAEVTSVLTELHIEHEANQQQQAATAPEVNPAKTRMMHALFKKAKINTHDQRVGFASRTIGRTVESTSDLTADELMQVCAALGSSEAMAHEDEHDAAMAGASS